ncbi:MAG TPA: hypothetical protein VNB90_07135 [Cytophagaceae bacterium]|nr:hypothetical protein [Cytophagaceae bacterium]
MLKKLFCTGIFIFLFSYLQAQDSTKYIRLSFTLFDNAASLPQQGFGTAFKSPIHPGLAVGTEFSLKKWKRTELYQTVKLGYFYHRFVQHAIQLYSETGYRYTHRSGLGVYGQLGAGYLHSFIDQQVFVFENGSYHEKKLPSRPQLMISLTPGIYYDFNKKCHWPVTVFFAYQAWLQLPYVKKYVTVFPNTALQLGAILSLKRKK